MVGDRPVGVELVGRPSWRSVTGRKTLPEVRKWSETMPKVWYWLGDPPEI